MKERAGRARDDMLIECLGQDAALAALVVNVDAQLVDGVGGADALEGEGRLDGHLDATCEKQEESRGGMSGRERVCQRRAMRLLAGR